MFFCLYQILQNWMSVAKLEIYLIALSTRLKIQPTHYSANVQNQTPGTAVA